MSEGNREMLLKTRGLTKQFGKHVAVDHVDMHIRRGAIYGFIGRNGAGKTTVLKMIAGLADPTAGEYGREWDALLSSRDCIRICQRRTIL